MSDGLASVHAEGPIYRLGRIPDPWAWPDWSYAAADGTFGNRWDDPAASYRVIYACSQRVGAFVETLARFRPDLEVVAAIAEIEGDDAGVMPSVVSRRWLEGRLIGEAIARGRFADVGDARSLATLRRVATSRATGKSVTLQLCDVFEIENGKIKALRSYFDSASLLTQIGVMPETGVASAS